MASETTSRRSFLGRLLGGTLVASVAGGLASIAAYLFPPDAVSSALGPRRVRVGGADDLAPGDGRLTLVEDEPVWVVRSPAGFMALSAWCTHKGCVVKWERERRVFACPCHEGLFDERGNVVSGLPLRPLSRFRVGLVSGSVYVSRADPTA
jgi:cytochrome b6-f complex iron-sulfur subunit